MQGIKRRSVPPDFSSSSEYTPTSTTCVNRRGHDTRRVQFKLEYIDELLEFVLNSSMADQVELLHETLTEVFAEIQALGCSSMIKKIYLLNYECQQSFVDKERVASLINQIRRMVSLLSDRLHDKQLRKRLA